MILASMALVYPAGIAAGQNRGVDEGWGGGIWPTERMTELILQRMAHGLREQYELDDAQADLAEAMMVKRWTGFLREHRVSLQPVLNEFFERQMSPTPPDPGDVALWAKDVRPVFNELMKEIRAGQAEFRGVLRPKQKMKFDADMLKYALGVQLIEQRLQSWERGEVNDTTLWNGSRGGLLFGEAVGPMVQSGDGPTSRPAIDAWEAFVQRFIRENELDDSQITTAMSVLTDLRDRATAYEEQAAIERESLRRRLAELDAPVDKMFAQLQTRLEGLVRRR
jgi:hypothetical protein